MGPEKTADLYNYLITMDCVWDGRLHHNPNRQQIDKQDTDIRTLSEIYLDGVICLL